MAYIHIPRRRIEQPQGRVQIDWANPLTRGLAVVINWADIVGRDLVRQNAPSAITASPKATSRGMGATQAVRAEWPASTIIKTSDGAGGSGFTLLSVAAPSPSTTIGTLASQTADSINQTYFLTNADTGYGASSGRLSFYGHPGNFSASAASVIDGATHVFCGTFTGSAGTIDVDGTERASGSGSSNIYTGFQRFCVEGLFGYSGYNDPNTPHLLTLAWDRGLSVAERQEVGRAPWQLFRADPIRFYSLASGGIPTLSALAASSVTSTGCSASVSLAF